MPKPPTKPEESQLGPLSLSIAQSQIWAYT